MNAPNKLALREAIVQAAIAQRKALKGYSKLTSREERDKRLTEYNRSTDALERAVDQYVELISKLSL